MNAFIERPATAHSLVSRKPIHGFGINDAKYLVQPIVDGKRQWCPFYAIWKGILKRVYCTKHHACHPTYADSSICQSWHVFSTFRAWMQQQPWQGNQIDKDLLLAGNKHYSPETCVFISKRTNMVLHDHAAARGAHPIGVSFEKDSKKFKAYCNTASGKTKNLGRYATPGEAHNAWRLAKSKVIIEVAQEQPDPRVRDALLKRAAVLQGAPIS